MQSVGVLLCTCSSVSQLMAHSLFEWILQITSTTQKEGGGQWERRKSGVRITTESAQRRTNECECWWSTRGFTCDRQHRCGGADGR